MKFTRRSLGSKIVLLAAAAQLLAAGFGVSALLTPSAAGAAQSVPYKVNFQGRLTDNSGNAMPDGLYNIKFRLFTALTAGSNVWEEDRIFTGVDNRIQLTSGLFNIQFGDLTALSPALFSSGTYPLYLEVELPTPATSTCATNACAVFTEGAMTPRQPLAASPYAISADTLDGLDSTAFGQLSANNTFTGANTFTPVAGVGITVKAVAATHSLDVKDASNVTQAFFDASGILNVAQTIQATVATVDIGTTGTPFRSGYFSTSVQTPALNASASGGTITTNLGTLQRVSPGTTTIDLKDPANTTLAVTNSGTGLASLSVEGGVAVGTGQLFSVGPTNGVTVSACSTSQYLASAAATGGLVTGGTCTSNDLQTVYNNSTSPASIGLTDGKNFVLNALDTTTDPSVLVNLQCVTCSASGGRFAVQHAGTDVFTVNPIGSLVVAPPAGQAVTFNLPGSSSAAFSSTSAPTTDLVSINNTGQPVATAGVNGLNITYIGGVGVIEASGARIDTTPGSTSGSTWNGLRLVSTTGPSAGVAFNGIKLEGPAAAAGGTATGLNITTGWDVGLNIQSGGIRMSAMTDPATPAIDTLAVYARTISGRTMLKSEGSSGVSYALQPSLFQQNIWIGQAGSANNTAQWQSQGAPGTYTTAPTLNTAGTQALSYNATFTTAAAANAANGFMQSTSSYFRGSIDNGSTGFFTASRVAFPGTLANYTSAGLGSRFWCGMTSQVALATMGANDTPTGDFAGFRLSGSAAETTFRFLTRNNATTTNQDTGVSLVVGNSYDMYIFVKNFDSASPTQNNTIYWRIDNLTSGAAPVEGSQTLTLPTATTGMRYMASLNTINNAAKQLDIQRMYVETDR